jgi:hypothetical protein
VRCLSLLALVTLSACASTSAVDGQAPLDALATDALQPEDAVVDRVEDARVDPSDAASGCGRCESYGPPRVSGRRPAALDELSGLAASATREGVFFAHNDSGDRPRIFALRVDGALLGEYAIAGAEAVDWEDIAVAPCPDGGSCIFIADVGDNASQRRAVDIYRVREPSTLSASAPLDATRFRVRYAAGPMNCEAMVVDRRDGASALLIEKSPRRTLRVARVDLASMSGGEVIAEELASIEALGDELVTAASMHPCEPSIVVRTYGAAWEFRGRAGASLDAILRSSRISVSVAAEVQGEAIAYLHDGRGWVTSSEGATALMSVVRCL